MASYKSGTIFQIWHNIDKSTTPTWKVQSYWYQTPIRMRIGIFRGKLATFWEENYECNKINGNKRPFKMMKSNQIPVNVPFNRDKMHMSIYLSHNF